jgi:hypothetical protein
MLLLLLLHQPQVFHYALHGHCPQEQSNSCNFKCFIGTSIGLMQILMGFLATSS